jgi:single-strand DNA-binding protein
MAGCINKVFLIGIVNSDPKCVNATRSVDAVVLFDVVTSESWRDRPSGEQRERTERHHVVVFNQQIAEIAMRYLRKGSKVYLEGELRTRQARDYEGQQRQTVEIVLSQYRGKLIMLDSLPGEIGAAFSLWT